MKLAIGIVVTAVVLFVFGFLFWAANPLPSASWNTAADQAAAQEAVRAHFPQSGVYNVPGAATAPSGVWAMVYVNHDVPETLPDPAEMLRGFFHYVLVALVLALLLRRQAPLAEQVKKAAVAGLAAVIVVEGSDVVWWGYPLGWKLWSVGYHELVFVIGALTLAKFLPASGAAQASGAAEA